jgi:hypothetical protein
MTERRVATDLASHPTAPFLRIIFEDLKKSDWLPCAAWLYQRRFTLTTAGQMPD